MLVETADAGAVAMRISRAEWAALREADIRTRRRQCARDARARALDKYENRTVRRRKGGAAHRQTHF